MHFHCPEIMWCFFSPLCVCVCELMCMLFKQASNTTKNWFTSLCWIGKMDGRSVSWWFLLSDFFMRVFHSEREKSLFGVTITQLMNLHVFHLFKKKKKQIHTDTFISLWFVSIISFTVCVYVIHSTWHVSTEIAMKCIYAERNAKLHFMTFVIYMWKCTHTQFSD